mmetsp:Transcript_16408/g.25997  ORF Transcript_16408/g.25997 Transcript_16408/m.25997 type:complete len:210 (+) Transcript_16408:936-1565(+)
MTIGSLDASSIGAKVRAGSNPIDVMVTIIVFLEVAREEFGKGCNVKGLRLFLEVIENLVLLSAERGCLLLLPFFFSFDLLRFPLRDLNFGCRRYTCFLGGVTITPLAVLGDSKDIRKNASRVKDEVLENLVIDIPHHGGREALPSSPEWKALLGLHVLGVAVDEILDFVAILLDEHIHRELNTGLKGCRFGESGPLERAFELFETFVLA